MNKKLKLFKYRLTIIYIFKMSNLLDKMFIKRFCLPSNTDLYQYENGTKNIDTCLCGHYNHVACILRGKDVLQK